MWLIDKFFNRSNTKLKVIDCDNNSKELNNKGLIGDNKNSSKVLINKVNKHKKNFEEAADENKGNQLVVNNGEKKPENLEVVNSSSSEYKLRREEFNTTDREKALLACRGVEYLFRGYKPDSHRDWFISIKDGYTQLSQILVLAYCICKTDVTYYNNVVNQCIDDLYLYYSSVDNEKLEENLQYVRKGINEWNESNKAYYREFDMIANVLFEDCVEPKLTDPMAEKLFNMAERDYLKVV